jgi:hypothetical protein
MKRLFSAVVALVLFTGASFAQSLTNGNFESPVGTFDYTNSGWVAFDDTSERQPWAAHTGVRAGYFPSWNGDSSGGVYQDVAATNGTYTFSMWMRLELGVSNQQMNLRLEWYDANTNALQLETSKDLIGLPADQQWHQVHVTGSCADMNLAFVRAVLYADWGPTTSPDDKAIMFDDAEFYAGSYTGTAPVLLSQSLEDGNGFRGSGWWSAPELDGNTRGGYRVWWAGFASTTGLAFNSFLSDSNNYSAKVGQNLYLGTGTYTYSFWLKREGNALLTTGWLSIATFDDTYTNKLEEAVQGFVLPTDWQWHEYYVTGTFTNPAALETRATLNMEWAYNTNIVGDRAMMADQARFYSGAFQEHLVTDWAYHNNGNLDAEAEQTPGGYGMFRQVNYATTTTTFYVLANYPTVANRADESGEVAIRTTWNTPNTALWNDQYNLMTWVANVVVEDTNQFHGTPLAGAKTLDLWKYDFKQPVDGGNVPYTNQIVVYYSPYVRSLLNGVETAVRWMVSKDGEITNNWLSNPQILGTQFANIDHSYTNNRPAAEDSDGDGMPDWWEAIYMVSLTNEAAGDFDSDGASNFDEWIADTTPNGLPAGLGAIPAMPLSVGGVVQLQINASSTARIYQVLLTTNLMGDASWQPLTTMVTGNSSTIYLLATNSLQQGFYRTGVKLP